MNERDRTANVSGTERDRMRLGTLQTSEASDTVEAFYDPDARSILREVPGSDYAPAEGQGKIRQLGEGESLGEAIERVGERLGWESLSEFAREHLESGDAETGDESGGGA